jgi:hypothetical protein
MSLKLVDVKFERAPKAHYGLKVRVVLEAETELTAWSPQWRTHGGIPIQQPFGSGLERRLGKAWEGKSLSQLKLAPGDQVRAWLGLDSTVSEDRIRAMQGGIGTLVVPTTNQENEWSETTIRI